MNFMNKLNVFLVLMIAVLLSTSVFAEEVTFENPDDSDIYITVNYDDSYSVDAGDSLDLDFDIEYTNDEDNDEVTINFTLVPKDNESDFDIADEEKEITLEDDGDDDTVTFELEVDEDADNDTSEFTLELEIDWDGEDSDEEIDFEIDVDSEDNDNEDEIDVKIKDENQNNVYVKVTSPQDTYYVDSGDKIDLDFDFDYRNSVDENKATIKAFLYVDDEDEEDEFDIEDDYQEITLDPSESQELTFEVEVDNSADNGTYDFTLEITTKWDNEEQVTLVPFKLKVDEIEDDLDIYFDNKIFCYDEEVFRTNLVFENNSNEEYLIKNIRLDDEDLWPKLEDDTIKIQEDDEEQLEVEFLRKGVPGYYEMDLSLDLYKGGSTSDHKTEYDTTLEVRVEDCKETNVSFTAKSNTNPDIKPNEPLYLSLVFKNGTNKEVPVYFKAESKDKSLVLSTNPKTKLVPANTSQDVIVTVIPTDSTGPGIKEIVVTAKTGFGTTLTQTINVNIISNYFDIYYSVPLIKEGLKATIPVTITYRGSTPASLTLRPIVSGSDVVYFDIKNVAMVPDETKTVMAHIVPKSQGYKSFVLKIEGDTVFDKTLYYSVSGKASTPIFIKSVMQNTNAKRNATNLLPIIVENKYDFDISIDLSIVDQKDITGIPQTVELKRGNKKSIYLQYYVGNLKTGAYTIDLLTKSELGTTTIPIKINVVENIDDMQGLKLLEVPEAIPFVRGQDITYTWKVSNLNGTSVSDAVIDVVKDGKVIATRVFPIDSDEIKDLEMVMNIDANESFVGKVVLTAGNNVTAYDIVFTPSNDLMAGLFSLGLGGTLGIILGLIILALILFLVFKKPSKTVVVKKEARFVQKTI